MRSVVVHRVASWLVAIVLSGTPVSVRTVRAEAPTLAGTTSRDPKPEHWSRFEAHEAKANRAFYEGRWDEFLSEAEAALLELPEHATTRLRRADLIDLVGGWKVEERNETELRASARILLRYLRDLQATYGDNGLKADVGAQAKSQLQAIEERLPAEPASDRPHPEVDAPPPRNHETSLRDNDRNRGSGTAFLVAGGINLGLGAVLTTVGAIYANRWSNNRDTGIPANNEVANAAWRMSAATMIPGLVLVASGVVFTVIGVRRRRSDRRVSFTPTGPMLRF